MLIEVGRLSQGGRANSTREWRDERNHLPPVAAIDQKISVKRQHRRCPVTFSHSHEAGISERCGYVAVFPQETADGGQFVGHWEIADQEAPFNQSERAVRVETAALQQEEGFCQNWLAAGGFLSELARS